MHRVLKISSSLVPSYSTPTRPYKLCAYVYHPFTRTLNENVVGKFTNGARNLPYKAHTCWLNGFEDDEVFMSVRSTNDVSRQKGAGKY